jgi:hypothetical protein
VNLIVRRARKSDISAVYIGPPIDDPELLPWLPSGLADFLHRTNGYVAYHGGFHLRGACVAPAWHSLRVVWLGDYALSKLFPAVRADDVPFGQDALGNQYLLRDGVVHQLWAETGDLESMAVDLETFDRNVREDPVDYLSLAPLEAYRASGHELEPGHLLHAWPPYCSRESEAGVSLRPVPALAHIAWLASFAKQLRDVPDGTRLKVVVREPPA